MRHTTKSATAILLFAIAQRAFGQEMAPRHEIGLTLGRQTGAARPDLDLRSGTALEANYGFRLTGGDKAALYGEVHFLSTPQQQVSAANAALTHDVATLFVTPGLRLKFLPSRAVSPYVAAGAGWALFEQSNLTIGGQPNPAPRLVNRGVFAYGGGVDVKVWRWLGLRGEIRDFYSGSPAYNSASIRGGQHNVVMGGGFVLRFR
jgi:opacity protein-like surface antigen